ncbi:non-ribosomal peptide synthetase [Coleofasciculus sp.]|uniref:non-ribosomal peptide synthetase n=1 Tax=Coleofasciculus sp. TaxID=3100458 RepID=UPI0039F7C049
MNFRKQLAISESPAISEVVEIPLTPAEALKHAVELRPDAKLICIETNGSQATQTYVEIWKRSEKILGGFRASGLQPGNPIIFQISTGQDFAPILWSCIIGGFIPVPVPVAANYSKPNQALSRLYNVCQKLDYPIILSNSTLASQVHGGLQLYGPKKVNIATLEEIESHSPDPRLHKHKPHELALLLPSSGTTDKCKLIEVSSCTFIYRFLQISIHQNYKSIEKVILSWFPLENISGILTTAPNDFQKKIHLPAQNIIRNPLLWLDALSKYRVTHAPTTNFILALVIDKLRTNYQYKWNFSSVQRIGIGAEPIVAKTARSFLEILGKYNLNPHVFGPVYGMTECGPIACSREGFSLTTTSNSDRFVEIGKPSRGHSIRIVDQQGSIIEEGQIGRIQVTGPSMTSGYYKAPELTRQLFTEDGWINTGDLGFLQDGKLTVTGREKETIIINARNFSCHEIELVVEEVEGVEPAYTVACAIRQQDSDTDELAIFFHTLITEPSQFAQLTKQIRGKVTQTLGINPTYIIPIDKATIPRTSTGKIQRLQLKQSLEAGEFDAIIKRVDTLLKQESEKTWVAPRDELELQLTQIWEKVLGKKSISINDNFFDLGGHSLIAVRLFDQIEKTFSQTLPLATLFQAATIEELANILRQSGCSIPQSSLILLQPHGSKPPFFYVTPAGVTALDCSSLVRHLTPDRPFYALQESGLEGELIHHTSIEEIATHYIQQIRTVQPSGPYFLGGACFGNVVAFEMAQQLYKQGEQIALLVIIDGFWPDHVAERPQSKLIYLVRYVTRHLTILSLLPPQEKWNYIIRLIQRSILKVYYKINPSRLGNSSLIDRAFYYQDLGRQLRIQYVPQVYPGRVSLIKANKKHNWLSLDPDKDKEKFLSVWNKFATEGAELYDFPGHHSFMFKEPYVQDLAEKLQICLDKAQTENSKGSSSKKKLSQQSAETLTQNPNLSKKESTTRFATPQDKLEPQPKSG